MKNNFVISDGDNDLELISGCSVYGLRVKLYVEEILKAG